MAALSTYEGLRPPYYFSFLSHQLRWKRGALKWKEKCLWGEVNTIESGPLMEKWVGPLLGKQGPCCATLLLHMTNNVVCVWLPQTVWVECLLRTSMPKTTFLRSRPRWRTVTPYEVTVAFLTCCLCCAQKGLILQRIIFFYLSAYFKCIFKEHYYSMLLVFRHMCYF